MGNNYLGSKEPLTIHVSNRRCVIIVAEPRNRFTSKWMTVGPEELTERNVVSLEMRDSRNILVLKASSTRGPYEVVFAGSKVPKGLKLREAFFPDNWELRESDFLAWVGVKVVSE